MPERRHRPGVYIKCARFEQLRQVKAWIIDLRWNGGGSSDIGYAILSHFIDAPVDGSTWRTRQYLPAYEAWGRQQTYHESSPDKIAPAAGPHYQGPVYVLTSPSTCSATEDFLIPLKMTKRATIVGEPSCGSTGMPLLFSIYALRRASAPRKIDIPTARHSSAWESCRM